MPRASMDEVRSNASYYGLEPQAVNESDDVFADRVIARLHDKGVQGDASALIIAHELECGRRYDDPAVDNVSGPLAGVTGAIAQALGGQPHGYGRSGVGTEVVLGAYINSGASERDAERNDAMRTAFEMLGPDAALRMMGG